jgi:hypothetical protein
VFLSAGKTFIVKNTLFLNKALFSSIPILRAVLIVVEVKNFAVCRACARKSLFSGPIFCEGQKSVLNAYLSA